MNQLGTVYATKRRRRNGKSLKPPPKDGVTKSNPSKRHRERLNAELDTLANLLPFEQNILSKLDRLSILRLSVSYLRTKAYFQVTMHKEKEELQFRRDMTAYDHTPLDGDMILQVGASTEADWDEVHALNGFLLILTCEGEVFFATHSIESYLGFHQSDIVHQSVYELVHSEDREELQRQLLWNSFLPADASAGGLTLQDALRPENAHLLERSFTVRFRCLLDNTSGFLRLDIRGRVKVLHGQNRKSEEPPLALFALCTPFGPPSLLEVPHKEVMFKSKHKLDLTLVSMDQRGKMQLGYTDAELANMGGYEKVHHDDLAYVASAHQELLKTGASGMIAYRLQRKDDAWQWLQTSSRLVYKNSKPDFVISTHRPLMEEEGRDLLGKRTMDFKVSYLEPGLSSSNYLSDSEQLVGLSPSGGSGSGSSNSVAPNSGAASPGTPTSSASQRGNRRYKTQLRDILSTHRTKRKLPAASPTGSGTMTPTVGGTVAGATAATTDYAYNLYPTAYQGSDAYMAPPNYQPLYENHNLFQYRTLGPYYPEYHSSAYVSNGFCTLPAYEPQLQARAPSPSPVTVPDVTGQTATPCKLESHSAGSSPGTQVNGMVTPKLEDLKSEGTYRQSVLMWGAGGAAVAAAAAAAAAAGAGTVSPSVGAAPAPSATPPSPQAVSQHASPPSSAPPQPSAPSDATPTGSSPPSPLTLKPYGYSGGYSTAASAAVAVTDAGPPDVWAHPQYYHPYQHHHNPHPPATDSTTYPQISRPGVLCCPSLR